MTNEIYLIADHIRSLHNVGSLFRTADAFGVAKIYLCGYTGTPPRGEIAKVALGAENRVAWEHKTNTAALIQELKKRGVYTVALEQTKKSVQLKKFRPRYHIALIVGNEG